MNRTNYSSRSTNPNIQRSLLGSRGFLFGVILLIALVCFESFNFSTTQVALRDLLGSLTFMGVSWATILAIAFCGIDFAGIARLVIPDEQISRSGSETWYLFGAWLLAATMNAMLTWWGVSLGLVNRSLQSTAFISQEVLLDIVPVFVALLVWLTRILLIGTFSIAGPRLFSTSQPTVPSLSTLRSHDVPTPRPFPAAEKPAPVPAGFRSRSNSQPRPARPEPEYVPDPAYAPLQAPSHSLSGKSTAEPQGRRRSF